MGSEADQDLNIKVSITGDTAGAAQAENALKGVKKAAEEAGHGASESAKQTKELGHEVKELSHLGHEAEAVLVGLEQGGLSGLARAGTNAAKVLKTVGSLLGGLSFGAILGILAAVTAAVLVLKNAFGEMGGEAESAEKKTEKLNKELAEIRAAAAEATAYQIKKIGLETDEAIKKVTALKDILLHLNENKLAVEQSKIKNSETLTPVQKERADFDAQSTARKTAEDETQKAIQLEIDSRKKEQELRIASLNEAVKEERELREEAEDLKRQQADFKEFKKAPSAVKFDEFGNDISDPEEVKKQHKEEQEFDGKKEEIERRLKLLEGNGPDNGGLLAAKSKDVIDKSRAASESDVKNLGDQGKIKRSGGELERLEAAAKVSKSDYETKQILANDEFVAKQKAENKKLETERTALEAEKAAIADKNAKSLTLGGDPAGNARQAEITKRQAAIDQDLAQRRGTVPQVQDNTKKRIKDFQSQQDELGKDIASRTAGEGFAGAGEKGGSGGTIEKNGQTIKVSSEHTVAELKKLGEAAAHGATETAKTAAETAATVTATVPKVQAAAAATAAALTNYTGAITGTIEAQTKQIQAANRKIEALRQQVQALTDNS